jgi:hypothetical protein
MTRHVVVPESDPLEDWATCTKAWCDRCAIEVRAAFFTDHLWILHGITADAVRLEVSS